MTTNLTQPIGFPKSLVYFKVVAQSDVSQTIITPQSCRKGVDHVSRFKPLELQLAFKFPKTQHNISSQTTVTMDVTSIITRLFRLQGGSCVAGSATAPRDFDGGLKGADLGAREMGLLIARGG